LTVEKQNRPENIPQAKEEQEKMVFPFIERIGKIAFGREGWKTFVENGESP